MLAFVKWGRCRADRHARWCGINARAAAHVHARTRKHHWNMASEQQQRSSGQWCIGRSSGDHPLVRQWTKPWHHGTAPSLRGLHAGCRAVH